MRSLIVYGPQGCGKTRNAKRIAAHFGLKHIADNWQAGLPLKTRDTLALTSVSPAFAPEGVDMLSFDRAVALL